MNNMNNERRNNVIRLYPSAAREGLDLAAVNRRAALRFRAAERRRDLLNMVEAAVTALMMMTKPLDTAGSRK